MSNRATKQHDGEAGPLFEFKSSTNSVRQAVETVFWRDIKDFLEDRISLHQTILENARDMNTIRHSQGVISNCRDVLELPGEMIADDEARTLNQPNQK